MDKSYMTTIQPINVPTKGIGNLFQLTALNFPMNPQSVTFYWQVFTSEIIEDISTPTNCIIDGNITMDADTYSQWGNNDEFCIQWACNLLNFVIV